MTDEAISPACHIDGAETSVWRVTDEAQEVDFMRKSKYLNFHSCVFLIAPQPPRAELRQVELTTPYLKHWRAARVHSYAGSLLIHFPDKSSTLVHSCEAVKIIRSKTQSKAVATREVGHGFMGMVSIAHDGKALRICCPAVEVPC